MFFPRFILNKGGIPALESTAVSVGTNVTFTFNSYPWLLRYVGLVLFKLSEIPSGTTTTLPIVFKIDNSEVAAQSNVGVALTAADITAEGLFLGYYNAITGELKLLTI